MAWHGMIWCGVKPLCYSSGPNIVRETGIVNTNGKERFMNTNARRCARACVCVLVLEDHDYGSMCVGIDQAKFCMCGRNHDPTTFSAEQSFAFNQKVCHN